jgi:hypothetical protein
MTPPPPPKEAERDDLQDCLLGRHQSNTRKSSKRSSKFLNRTVIVRSTPIRREFEKTDTTNRLSVVKTSRSGSIDIETESFGFRPDSVQV